MRSGWFHCTISLLAILFVNLQAAETPVTPSTAAPANKSAATSKPGPNFPEAEQLFLTGKMSAREFQHYIARRVGPRKPPPAKVNPEQEQKAVEILRTHKADPANNPPPGPAIKPENLPSVEEIQAQPPSDISKDFISIEEKVDMLLKQQEERKKAEENALQEAMDPASKNAKSARERLDDLLRLYIHGKITQAEYNEKRKAIITGNK